ncbi:MAG TPA: DUF11 domain-containing protein [Thermoanaerobaculia bacterium]
MRSILSSFRRHSSALLKRSACFSAVMIIGAAAANAQTADLSITKQVTPAQASPGDIVTYTLTAHNAGPDTVFPLLLDSLPSGLTLVSAPRCAEFPAMILTCSLESSLAPGQEASITIVARVENIPDGTIVNGANITGFDDPDLTNNFDEATLRVVTPISAVPSLGFYGLAVFAVLLAAVAVYRVRLA